MVPALLYRPLKPDGLPPAVIYIHGGPNWLTQITWDPLVQHMVSRGWVVLAPNYRGSTGYGREWHSVQGLTPHEWVESLEEKVQSRCGSPVIDWVGDE